MVVIKNSSKEPVYISLLRGWRDHREQLAVMGIFTGVLVIWYGILLIRHNSFAPMLLFWFILCFIILLYYFLPTMSLRLNLSTNLWIFRRRIFGIPVSSQFGKISDISKFIARDIQVEEKTAPKKFNLNRTQFISTLEMKFFDSPALTVYSRKTYSFTSHQHEMDQNFIVGRRLLEFLSTFGLPIEFQLDQK